jgi:hypothetical protein
MPRNRLLCALTLCLSGCGFWQKPEVAAPAPVAPKRDVIAEIRKAAANAGDVLNIVPIQSPAITALFDKIEAADALKDHVTARELTVEARTLDPENPLVLQYTAEALFRNDAYNEAEAFARKSFEHSAQLGPLCVRNWLLIAAIRSVQKNETEAQTFKAEAERCIVKPQQRL